MKIRVLECLAPFGSPLYISPGVYPVQRSLSRNGIRNNIQPEEFESGAIVRFTPERGIEVYECKAEIVER